MTASDAQALLQLMRSRRSVRRFRAEPPPRAQIERLLDAAITAPSASNKQPWRFCVVTDAAVAQAMAAAVQAVLDRLLPLLDDAARREIQAYGRYFVRFVDAPVVVVPFHRPLALLSHLLAPGDDDLAARARAMEQASGSVSTALAVQNLLLAAHAEGLGASCLSGPLLAAPEIAALLRMGAGWQPSCLVALGHADEDPPAPPRKRADTVTRWFDAPAATPVTGHEEHR